MAVSSRYTRALTVSDLAFGVNATINSNAAIPVSRSIAAAKAGTLTTRTSDTVGTLTMAGGHGITTGQRLDLFWDGGSRVGLLVGTVAVNSVPFTLGSGDNLPVQDTVITACVPTEQNFDVTGDNVTSIGCAIPLGGAVTFTDGSDVLIFSRTLTTAVPSYVWCDIDGGTNPLAGGAVGKVYLSNASTATAQTVNTAVQYN